MADLDRYLRYLQRGDVEELVLQTGKVAALKLSAGKLHPLTKTPLAAGHIVALLNGADLRELLPSSDTPGEPQAVEVEGRAYTCRVARRGNQLQLRFSAGSAGAAAPKPKPKPKPTPAPPPQRAPATLTPAVEGGPQPRVARPKTGPRDIELDADDGISIGLALDDAGAQPKPSPPPAPSPASAAIDFELDTEGPSIGLALDDGAGAPAGGDDDLLATPPLASPSSPAPPGAVPIPGVSPGHSPGHGGPPPRSASAGSKRFLSRPAKCTWARGTPEARMLAMLTEARESGASDIHLVGDQPARFRRLGSLSPVGPAIAKRDVEPMLMPLMRQAGDTLTKQLEDIGYADFSIQFASTGRMRVNFAKGRTGLKGCFRVIIDTPPTLTELGLPKELGKVAEYHQGLAIVSGPSGQGKTTTMAALVDLVNRNKPDHIITVEDPIEVVHPIRRSVISQRQVGLHTASFHRALKAALREDPDVIVIGELRDRETVEMALQAAETGHLVIASMSTPSGAKTIDRLIDMFPPDDQSQVRSTLAGALKIVVSQRLVPAADGTRMVAAAELITGNIPLWSLIRENKLYQLPSLLQRGRNYGMIRVEDSLNELLAQGVITEAMAKHYADDPRSVGTKGASTSQAPAQPKPGLMGGLGGAKKPPPTGGPPGGSAGNSASQQASDLGKAAFGAMRNMFGRKKGDD
ncbi:type IV pilus twitching motility protein PilT [Plesiocystis pacifica]|uniref:type IV pilus twitching motility protein PilT n=1 Tax=Plesiocystis pacifica TaxID=191768 RepID=UPI0006A71BB8|nr:PilT/PilU family type 4a pilus ATPase [Plesiocystis pacifica]